MTTTNKIDKRKKYVIVLDTETCPVDKTLKKVDPYNMWTYDIGFAVVDKKGNVYETRSFVNADIFLHEKDLMRSAYYADKIPMYWDDIKAGRRILTSFYKIRCELLDCIEKYDVTEIYAHNMRFDYGTLNNTQRWISKSKYRYYFPYGMEICDTLKMAKDVLSQMPTYRRFCETYGLLTKTGRLSYTAENIFRFITKNPNFVESHTGLEDVLIEKEIYAYCVKQHKKMRKLCFGD